MTEAEVDQAVEEIRQAEFQYACAALIRQSQRRKLEALEATDMAERTVAMLEQAAHHRVRIREAETVMNHAVQTAQAVEARALQSMED